MQREFVAGVAMVDYTGLGDLPADRAEVLYYHRDVLGSTAALTDAFGAIVERYVYDPYGQTTILSASGQPLPDSRGSDYGNPFGWTNQRYDATTKLYHFYARSYSPKLGRFLSRDPLGYVDGMSLYEYVGSSPTNFTDPLGLCYGLPGCGVDIGGGIFLTSIDSGGGGGGGSEGRSGGACAALDAINREMQDLTDLAADIHSTLVMAKDALSDMANELADKLGDPGSADLIIGAISIGLSFLPGGGWVVIIGRIIAIGEGAKIVYQKVTAKLEALSPEVRAQLSQLISNINEMQDTVNDLKNMMAEVMSKLRNLAAKQHELNQACRIEMDKKGCSG